MTRFRTETIGDATLYCGDCSEVLPPLTVINAVVTDPPYGVGFSYESHEDSADTYADDVVSRILDLEAILVGDGPMCVFQSATHAPRWAQWFPREFRPIALTKAFVQMRAGFVTSATDYALMWFPNGKPKTQPAWQPDGARDWFYSPETAIPRSGPEREHPCPRPLDMMRYLVSRFCAPRSTVLDPFMGSGTTGVACVKLGRKFIGIEIEPKYFDIACRRIEEAWKQPRLFDEPKAKPTQPSMLEPAP